MGVGVVAVYVVARPARQQKMGSQCSGNLHMLGFAMAQYTQDYDETLPRAWFGPDDGPSDAKRNSKWMDALFRYAKDERLFVCPADAQSKPYRLRQGESYGSYLFNDAYFAPGDKFSPPGGRRLSSIADFYTPLVMCGASGSFRFGWPDAQSTPQLEEDRAGDIRLLHPGSAMTLWINGSVQGYRPAQILWARHINGQRVFTGLTVEQDSSAGVP